MLFLPVMKKSFSGLKPSSAVLPTMDFWLSQAARQVYLFELSSQRQVYRFEPISCKSVEQIQTAAANRAACLTNILVDSTHTNLNAETTQMKGSLRWTIFINIDTLFYLIRQLQDEHDTIKERLTISKLESVLMK